MVTHSAVEYVQSALREKADRQLAKSMANYMYGKRWQQVYSKQRGMPFYGVQKPSRTPILRSLVRDFPPSSREAYEQLVVALWTLPHREEKYLAQGVATSHRQFIVPDSLPLYRRMIVEGAWWDLVDEVATHMIRPLVLGFPERIWQEVDLWIDDESMWLRRAAIICQVGAKERTDEGRLLRFCAARMHEREFFIRKAIGWALREFAKTDPEAVAGFVTEHRESLSGLSYREATKHLGNLGM